MDICTITGEFSIPASAFVKLTLWSHFHRDSTEELKKLTPSERQEMKNQDVGYLSSDASSTTIRRRERALKIYVDSSPKKRDE